MVGFSQLENVDKAFANKLSNVVNGKGAFAKFKSLIRNSRYEDAWYKFKNDWYIDYVNTCIYNHNNPDNNSLYDDEDYD